MIREGSTEKSMRPPAAPVPAKKLPTLWVITELYHPENNQTGYYMTGIAEGLADDFSVKVICGQPNYAARGTRADKREVYKKVEIFRVCSTTLDKNILIFRLVNMLTLGISMFLKTLAKIKKNEKILVVSAPPTLPFFTALAAKIRRAKYSLIIQDKYPETLVAVGKLKPDSIFIKVLNKLNEKLYGGANKIIVVGRDMRELVVKQLERSGKKAKQPVEVIQNWASLEEIEPQPRNENQLLKQLNLLDKFVFLYAGNMGHPQDIESIVDCAEKLKNDGRFHFLFIGSGVKRKRLEEKVKNKDLRNVTILAPLPRGEQRLFLNACDVGLVSLVKNMRGLAMPSRTYNFLAAGKPVLALTEENSEVAYVLEEDDLGWFAPPGEPRKLLELVREIYKNRAELPELQKRARRIAVEKYSVETAVEKYKKILSSRV